MKYILNGQEISFEIDQPIINDASVDYHHLEWLTENIDWYDAGFKVVKVPPGFLEDIRTNTFLYINERVREATSKDLVDLESYHRTISDAENVKVLKKVGKLINPKIVGIDLNILSGVLQSSTGVSSPVFCGDICDIRIFRPYKGDVMDNNPLHRDTWLPLLNNCINIYIPVAGNNELSTLSLIPGSHLWDRNLVERTESNATIKGVKYGLPSITEIKRPFEVFRPTLADDEILVFSSNLIHGGAVNLNEDITRVSIEIRFWK